MSKAIRTHILGATNYRSTRVKAQLDEGRPGQSVTISYDDGKNASENHAEAVRKLIEKLDWSDRFSYVGGHFGRHMYWVFTDSEYEA